MIALSAGLTWSAWSIADGQIREKSQRQFERQAAQVIELVRERMQRYEDALWSGVALHHSKDGDVNHDQWHAFAESIRIDLKYPGINGIGVIHSVAPDEFDAYLDRERQRRPDYAIHPDHDGLVHLPITYIEPVESNRQAVGLDIAHETNRLTAALKARDTGDAQITGPIVLVQDSGRTAGFLFYAPFYEGSSHPAPGERAGSFRGLVYAPFVVQRLMEGTLHRESRQVVLRLRDGADVIYDELDESQPEYDPAPQFSLTSTVPMYGRSWTFDIASGQSFHAAQSSSQPLVILVGGIIIDTLLIGLFFLLTRANRGALRFADLVTRELRATNDDLVEARAEAVAASEAKSVFLANMSHEIRTPMTAILGYSETLADTIEDPERALAAETIQRNGRHLLTIINDILDLSKIEAHGMTVESIACDPVGLIEEVAGLMEAKARARGLSFDVEYAGGMPATIRTDPTRLRQILLNLLGNAIKFTERGGVRLVARCVVEADPPVLELDVIDSGVGLTPGQAKRLFEPFHQADASTTRRFGGTGLGLAISRRLAELLGGTVVLVESRVGAGSRFRVNVATGALDGVALAEVTRRHRPPATETGAAPTAGGLGGCRILLAEDGPDNQRLISFVLRKAGAEVTIVANGAEARDAALAAQAGGRAFDCILMDMQMPVLSGYEATARLRAAGYDGLVVALTANAMDGDREKCLAAGCDDFATKPIDRARLTAIIAGRIGVRSAA